jgi:hypothetical protein
MSALGPQTLQIQNPSARLLQGNVLMVGRVGCAVRLLVSLLLCPTQVNASRQQPCVPDRHYRSPSAVLDLRHACRRCCSSTTLKGEGYN